MIPHKVIVYGLEYDIEVGALNQEWGVTDMAQQLITLSRSQSTERMKDTLCHEIGHCITEHFRSAFESCPEDKREEMACDWFAHFRKVLKDNPDLKLYLFE